MAHLREHWFPYLLCAIILIVIKRELSADKKDGFLAPAPAASIVPSMYELSNSEEDNLIRYGRELIDSTSWYFGPHGRVAAITNGLNCQHCHRESGTKLYTNNFLAVASTYPKFRERSGRVESLEWRINECMQRSLNGQPIDSLSKEMRAMVAYINWTGKKVKEKSGAEGAGTKELDFLSRAADPDNGALIYTTRCSSCHGKNGEGILSSDSLGFIVPAVWGQRSYAVSAGMFRLSKLASFIKYNMPLGATYSVPYLNDDDAWDVAAYINAQPHPEKMFAADWPVLQTKPVDYPFGPYKDSFSEKQHKYGPFITIKNMRDQLIAKKKK